MGRWTGKSCRLTTMMVLTSSFFLVEMIVGYVTNSISLVADSFHMLSDLAALIVGLTSVKLSKKKSKGNTFGWHRAEVLGALINCVFLTAMCFSILVESLKRLVHVEEVENPLMLMVVGGVGLVVNLIGLGLFGGHGHSHGGGHGHGHSHDVTSPAHLHANGHDVTSPAHLHANGHDVTSEKTSHNGNGYVTDIKENYSDKVAVNGDCAENERLVNHSAELSTTIATNGHIKNHINYSHNHNHHHHHSDNSHNCGDIKEKELYGIGDNVEIEIEKNSSPSSMNMRGVFLHVLGDALGSVVVLASGTAMWVLEGEWRFYLDPILSFTIVGIILYTTIPLFKETCHILLQAVPRGICVDVINQQLLEIQGVTEVIQIHIWQLSGDRNIASVHVSCPSLHDFLAVSSRIEKVFHAAGIQSVTVQPHLDKPPPNATPVAS